MNMIIISLSHYNNHQRLVLEFDESGIRREVLLV